MEASGHSAGHRSLICAPLRCAGSLSSGCTQERPHLLPTSTWQGLLLMVLSLLCRP